MTDIKCNVNTHRNTNEPPDTAKAEEVHPVANKWRRKDSPVEHEEAQLDGRGAKTVDLLDEIH